MLCGGEGRGEGQVVSSDNCVECDSVYDCDNYCHVLVSLCCCWRKHDVGVVLTIDASCNQVRCVGVNARTGQMEDDVDVVIPGVQNGYERLVR